MPVAADAVLLSVVMRKKDVFVPLTHRNVILTNNTNRIFPVCCVNCLELIIVTVGTLAPYMVAAGGGLTPR